MTGVRANVTNECQDASGRIARTAVAAAGARRWHVRASAVARERGGAACLAAPSTSPEAVAPPRPAVRRTSGAPARGSARSGRSVLRSPGRRALSRSSTRAVRSASRSATRSRSMAGGGATPLCSSGADQGDSPKAALVLGQVRAPPRLPRASAGCTASSLAEDAEAHRRAAPRARADVRIGPAGSLVREAPLTRLADAAQGRLARVPQWMDC